MNTDPRPGCSKQNDDLQYTPRRRKLWRACKESGQNNDQEVTESCNGCLIWGKLRGYCFWPGIVFPGHLAGHTKAETGKFWIFWFADYKISKVSEDSIIPFVASYSSVCKQTVSKKVQKMYSTAIREAVKVCEQRSGIDVRKAFPGMSLQDWADKGFPVPQEAPQEQVFALNSPPQDNPLPEFVLERLKDIARSNVDFEEEKVFQWRQEKKKREEVVEADAGSAIELVLKGERKIEEICLACDDPKKVPQCHHPLFEGGLCGNCMDCIMQSLFTLDKDGVCMFCIICGGGGSLFICNDEKCSRTFCFDCISLYFGDSMIKKINSMKCWQCFFCLPYSETSHGPIRPRANWKHNMARLFDAGGEVHIPELTYLSNPDEQKGLNVLSLYDGIGTGKVILKLLGIKVDAYYSCEVDKDAMKITSYHHGKSVIQLGNVQHIRKDKLKDLGDIDLVIGAPPYKDFKESLSESDEGTYLLFFEYHRILTNIEEIARRKGRHVFWMFENVPEMESKIRTTINRFFKINSALWDMEVFDNKRWTRLIWSNIPGVYDTPYLGSMEDSDTKTTVQENLIDIGTVIDGENSDIDILENLEKFMGFPPSYTDVCDIPIAKQCTLLADAFNIKVIKKIFSSLKHYFKEEDVCVNKEH